MCKYGESNNKSVSQEIGISNKRELKNTYICKRIILCKPGSEFKLGWSRLVFSGKLEYHDVHKGIEKNTGYY